MKQSLTVAALVAAQKGDDAGFGCCYQGECCMPGIHLLSECHTAADVEAQYEETPNAIVTGLAPGKDTK